MLKSIGSFIGLSALLVMVSNTTVLANESQTTDKQDQATAEIKNELALKENTVVSFFNRYWMPVNGKEADGYYRKLIKIEGENLFLIQDFFTDNNQKQSDPVLVSNIYELKSAGFLRTIKGPYVTWYSNGQKQSESFYKSEGVLDGLTKSWYSNGTQKASGTYNENKKTGKWEEWYENGHLKLQTNYLNGLLQGDYSRWFENGQQQAVGVYDKGLLNGFWTVWNSKGDKISEGEYVKGRREKVWTYFSAGKKWAQGNYIDNLQDGLWIYWDADGNELKSILYQKGVQVAEESL